MGKACRSCCSSSKYTITSMQFYGCTDVVSQGFTVSFYPNWTSGTTIPGGSPEHSETVTSLPYSYAPSNPLQKYGILFQKTGWITAVYHANALNSTSINIGASLAPLAVNVTHDFGSSTLSAMLVGSTPYTSTSVADITTGNLIPNYKGCFTGTGNVVTKGDVPLQACPGTGGTFAFQLAMGANVNCNGFNVGMNQTLLRGRCDDGSGSPIAAYYASTCGTSGNIVWSDASGLVGTISYGSPNDPGCGTPLDLTFEFPNGTSCGVLSDLIGTASATVTF